MRPEADRKTKLVLALVLAGVMLFTSGCGITKALSSLKDRFAGQKVQEVKSPGETPINLVPEQPAKAVETTKVVLYFTDATGQFLAAEEREIPKVVGIARSTIEQLIMGPKPGSSLLPTIPYGTQLKDINIKPDGLAIVDFSKELIANHIGGKAAQELTIYSVVNTLTQFPTVDRVQFRIEGQNVERVGSVVVAPVMTRKDSIIGTR
ncbi:MAG: GerMN domain-containing protein [Bacillota bacterium]